MPPQRQQRQSLTSTRASGLEMVLSDVKGENKEMDDKLVQLKNRIKYLQQQEALADQNITQARQKKDQIINTRAEKLAAVSKDYQDYIRRIEEQTAHLAAEGRSSASAPSSEQMVFSGIMEAETPDEILEAARRALGRGPGSGDGDTPHHQNTLLRAPHTASVPEASGEALLREAQSKIGRKSLASSSTSVSAGGKSSRKLGIKKGTKSAYLTNPNASKGGSLSSSDDQQSRYRIVVDVRGNDSHCPDVHPPRGARCGVS